MGSAEIDLRDTETHSEGVLEKQSSSTASSATPAVMSSADLIKSMKIRNIMASNTPSSSRNVEGRGGEDGGDGDGAVYPSLETDPSTATTSLLTSEGDHELIQDIRHFIAFQATLDGVASTDELLEKFKEKVPREDTAKFKQMLKEICDYTKDENGKGLWRLKDEFQ